MQHKLVHMITFLLLVAGGLNWLLFGLFDWEVGMFLGGMSDMLARGFYILVGLAAVYELFIHKRTCTLCTTKPASGMQPM